MVGDWIDTERAFGLDWRDWGRLATVSWLVLFGASWVSLLGSWTGGMTVSLWGCGAALGGVVALNGIPGIAAMLDPWVRTRLLSIAEAAVLASLTLSALAGIGSFAAVFLLLGEKAYVIGAGIIIGIVSFPLSFGLVFPLGIPLACSVLVWAVVNARGCISRRAFVMLASVSATGWLGVVLIGAALGVGA